MNMSEETASPKDVPTTPAAESDRPSNFIREIFVEDLKTNKYKGRVWTRFPPEPNGYLHIGHAKVLGKTTPELDVVFHTGIGF